MAISPSIVRAIFESSIKNIDQNELYDESQSWALAHGFVRCIFTDQSNSQRKTTVKSYPFTIFPSPFPTTEYKRALQTQYIINNLVHRLAFDTDLMDTVFQPLVDCDPFIKRLRDIYRKIQMMPYQSVAETCIIRTDYMLQSMKEKKCKTYLRLIEINTIAVGLGAAAKLMVDWHKHMLTRYCPEFLTMLPENESHDLIIETLYQSWRIYNKLECGTSLSMILFVIPQDEFNIGDQVLIEQGILCRAESDLLIKYVTFADLFINCSVDQDGKLYYSTIEVALVYYRYGYDPQHFSSEKIWQVFTMIESSRAIKCPSLRYHLAGMKCFQMALADDTFLKTIFLNNTDHLNNFKEICGEIFTIDQVISDPILQHRIQKAPDSFYLKQSREGGGHVYCGTQLNERINRIIADGESKRYFLMARVYGEEFSNLIQPSGNDRKLIYERINGEFGMFAGLISQNGQIISERVGGSLLRSKPVQNVEGGIASGQGYIDSILLV